MNEFRRDVPLDHTTPYWFVEMGPIPDKPDWHQELYRFQSYPFPTVGAAIRFATRHRELDPDRDIAIRTPEGTYVA